MIIDKVYSHTHTIHQIREKQSAAFSVLRAVISEVCVLQYILFKVCAVLMLYRPQWK